MEEVTELPDLWMPKTPSNPTEATSKTDVTKIESIVIKVAHRQ